MDVVGRSASEIAAAVRARQVPAADVVRAHLARLHRIDGQLGAFVHVRGERALSAAAALDAMDDLTGLPLAGVPVAVTDVIDVAGSPTRHGSAATSDVAVDADSEVVRRLQAAGAVVLGKTRCPELALWGTSDDAEGIAVSPWDPTRSAGGPSGGSGAAVGAAVVPVAIGPDGLGSIRLAAGACGVVGARPGSAGLPEVIGGVHQAFGTSRYGVLTTRVDDAALVLDVLAGRASAAADASEAALKVAVSWKAPAPGVVVSSAWREAALEAGRLLHHGGHEVTHQDPPYDRSSVQGSIGRWTQGAGVLVDALGLDVDALQPRTRAHVAAGARLAKVARVQQDDADRWRERLQEFFTANDVLITPTFARVQPSAQTWHTKPWAANIAAELSAYPFTPPWTLADLPSVVVPLWQDGGRPLSVQVVAGVDGEAVAFRVAAQLEELVPRERHAPGWDD